MKNLLLLSLLTMGLASCSKIQEGRLTDAWTLTRWEVTDEDGNKIDGFTEFDDRIGGEVRVEFLNDGGVIIQDFVENDIVAEEEGTYSTDEGVDNITFNDSVWMFNQGATYSIDQLKRGELVLSGPFNTGRQTYTGSTMTFTVR